MACALTAWHVNLSLFFFFVKNSVSQKIKSSSFEVSSVCFRLVYEAQNFMSTHFQVVSKSRGNGRKSASKQGETKQEGKSREV